MEVSCFARCSVDFKTADVMLSSVTASPDNISTTRPREKIATLSDRPATSCWSEETKITATPDAAASRMTIDFARAPTSTPWVGASTKHLGLPYNTLEVEPLCWFPRKGLNRRFTVWRFDSKLSEWISDSEPVRMSLTQDPNLHHPRYCGSKFYERKVLGKSPLCADRQEDS